MDEERVSGRPGRGRRFAIAASDPYLGVLLEFVQAGWVPVVLHVVAQEGMTASSRWTIQTAQQMGMSICIGPLDDRALEHLCRLGCELLVVASHDWKVGRWERWLPYAINFHPSYLPYDRGPYPQVQAILRGERRWGVSCHRISDSFDAGDLLQQQAFAMDADETLERLNLRIRLASTRLASSVASHFDELWASARPQGTGSYVRRYTDTDRLLDFTAKVADLERRVRAFGPLECLADLRGMRVRVLGATFWRETHDLPAGTLVTALDGELIIAVADGYAGITRWVPLIADPGNLISPA